MVDLKGLMDPMMGSVVMRIHVVTSGRFCFVHPRPKGELAVEHKQRGHKAVLGCPAAPISVIYRNGCHMVKIGETSRTGE